LKWKTRSPLASDDVEDIELIRKMADRYADGETARVLNNFRELSGYTFDRRTCRQVPSFVPPGMHSVSSFGTAWHGYWSTQGWVNDCENLPAQVVDSRENSHSEGFIPQPSLCLNANLNWFRKYHQILGLYETS